MPQPPRRRSIPPPLPNPKADTDLNDAAQRFWSLWRRAAWFVKVGVGIPEPVLHVYANGYHRDLDMLFKNGWSGFRVIVHILV